jgi:hypothetical protein
MKTRAEAVQSFIQAYLGRQPAAGS